LNIEYQCLAKIKGSSKKIYIVPDGTTGFMGHIKVDIIMCTEKFYKSHKYFLDPLLKEGGEYIFI